MFYASSSQRYLRYIENVKVLRDIRVGQVFAFLLNISEGFTLILYILVRVYIFICIDCVHTSVLETEFQKFTEIYFRYGYKDNLGNIYFNETL